jgi:hypothetical protein
MEYLALFLSFNMPNFKNASFHHQLRGINHGKIIAWVRNECIFSVEL